MTDLEAPDDDAEPSQHDISPEDLALGPMMEIMVWREGDTVSTIDDALHDGPRIVGEIAAEIAAERGLPADWLKQLGSLVEQPPPDDPS